MWCAVYRQHPQSVGGHADYPKGSIQRDRAAAHVFRRQLSTLINQIVLEKQNCEPPLVRKARHYIEQHKMEPISLATIARASGANVSYFCKVFKKTTGLTFTDYLGRVRLEDTKAQLLNPNPRPNGRIAYDVGFQSLAQIQPDVQTRFWPITDGISRAPRQEAISVC